jgi:D-glycero-D-manno-heptose 1,7-bisphosphate phosphatase
MVSKSGEVKLYIFDADGTLRHSIVPGRPIPNKKGEWELLPNVKEKLQKILSGSSEPLIAIASNQGGIELGYLSRKQARTLLNDLYRELTGKRPSKGMVQLCPDYKKLSSCRKPKPGMVEAIIKQVDASPEDTLFVGNSEDDRLTALNAGVPFMWARDFFGWQR